MQSWVPGLLAALLRGAEGRMGVWQQRNERRQIKEAHMRPTVLRRQLAALGREEGERANQGRIAGAGSRAEKA